jgi:hypothetical protein
VPTSNSLFLSPKREVILLIKNGSIVAVVFDVYAEKLVYGSFVRENIFLWSLGRFASGDKAFISDIHLPTIMQSATYVSTIISTKLARFGQILFQTGN